MHLEAPATYGRCRLCASAASACCRTSNGRSFRGCPCCCFTSTSRPVISARPAALAVKVTRASSTRADRMDATTLESTPFILTCQHRCDKSRQAHMPHSQTCDTTTRRSIEMAHLGEGVDWNSPDLAGYWPRRPRSPCLATKTPPRSRLGSPPDATDDCGVKPAIASCAQQGTRPPRRSSAVQHSSYLNQGIVKVYVDVKHLDKV